MITYLIPSKPRTVRAADVSSVADVAIYTATDAIEAMLDSMAICNKTGAGVSVDVWHFSGVSDYLLKGKVIPANDTLFLNDLNQRLEKGAVLNVRAGTAAAVDISATIMEMHRNTPR